MFVWVGVHECVSECVWLIGFAFTLICLIYLRKGHSLGLFAEFPFGGYVPKIRVK